MPIAARLTVFTPTATPPSLNSLYSLYSLYFSVSLFLLLTLTTPLPAWGPLGHSTIAAIAEKHLSSAAQSHIAALLTQGHDTDLPSIANWADDVRAAAARAVAH